LICIKRVQVTKQTDGLPDATHQKIGAQATDSQDSRMVSDDAAARQKMASRNRQQGSQGR
jgi:hypothetical protein